MISGVCKLCGDTAGEVILDVSACADTYMDYLAIDYRQVTRSYKACRSCGLVYRDPQFSEQEKKQLYQHFRDVSLRRETGEAYFQRVTNLPRDESENYEKYQYLQPHLATSGRLLDVGAGFGVFIYGFARHFPEWQVKGIEPTAEVASVAEAAGVEVVETYLSDETRDLIGTQFDLITSIHVLEHVDQPLEFLQLLSNYLRVGGLLYVEVPSIRDVGYLPPAHDRFMCQHEVIFDDGVLRRLVQSAELAVVDIQHFISRRQRNNLRVLCKRVE